MFRKVFYTVPSRLIGYELKLRAFDDRLELFLGNAHLETLPRGRAPGGGRGGHAYVVDYHHVIHSLRTKPGAFTNLTYRDALFPRTQYRRCWDALVTAMSSRRACQVMVDLLWLAHEQACEASLANELDQILATGGLPDLDALRTRFARSPQDSTPDVAVHLPAVGCYDSLIWGPGAAA